MRERILLFFLLLSLLLGSVGLGFFRHSHVAERQKSYFSRVNNLHLQP